MSLKQFLQLKQQQKLSPLQMQVIKLTELPCIELEDRIKQELEDNPALDEGSENEQDNIDDNYAEDGDDISQEEITLGDYLNEDEVPDYRLSSNNQSTSTPKEDILSSTSTSLHESLLEQLHLYDLDVKNEKIAEYIIGNMDENGYLERSLTAITDDMLFQQGLDVSEPEVAGILQTIQELEPAGIGARDLRECLLLQLQRLPEDRETMLAIQLVDSLFDEFSKKHFDKIKKTLSIDDEELRKVIQEIVSLNPKPGNTWGDTLASTMNTIIPDFIVEAVNGELFLSLNNRNMPELKVNRTYADMLQGYSGNRKSMTTDEKNAVLFVKQKLDSARWFIEAIKQRQETLQRTMQAIVDLQYDFFLTGDEFLLKPMILKDIAERSGYDISTISRVSNSKYVQTNFGAYPLKYFFSESMQNDAGEEISSREIKAILKECIETEDSKKPLTDDKLAEILKEKGYLIARRTVAKYREQMGFSVARLRRNF